jgi:hypothetical protein
VLKSTGGARCSRMVYDSGQAIYVNTSTEVLNRDGTPKQPTLPELNLNYTASHVITKGTCTQVEQEALKFTGGGVYLEGFDDILKECVDEVCDANRHELATPHTKSNDDTMEGRNMKASPGEPYRSSAQTLEELVEKFEMANLIAHFDSMESEIVMGTAGKDWDMFLVHSKTDKYSCKKLKQERFRTIQGSNAFVQHLTDKYLSWAGKAVALDPECMTSFQLPEYASRVLKGVGTKYYLSADFSGYDRTQAQNVVRKIVELTSLKNEGMPQSIRDFLVEAISAGMCVLPNGKVIVRPGGNPSGQGLTTYVNCIFHKALIRAFCTWAKEIHGSDLDFKRLICGDDGVYGSDSLSDITFMAKYLPEFIQGIFGIATGFEKSLKGKEIFEFPEVPVFLGRIIAEDSRGHLIGLLVDVPRVLASIYNQKWHSQEAKAEKFMGIYVAMASWRLLLDCEERDGLTPLIPDDMRTFFEEAHDVLPKIPTHEQCSGWSAGFEVAEADAPLDSGPSWRKLLLSPAARSILGRSC